MLIGSGDHPAPGRGDDLAREPQIARGSRARSGAQTLNARHQDDARAALQVLQDREQPARGAFRERSAQAIQFVVGRPALDVDIDAAGVFSARSAEILPMPGRRKRWGAGLAAGARQAAAVVLPPMVTIGLLLLVWQVVATSNPGGLPAPSTIWSDSRDLILHPMFDHGGVDKGLFWHALTSLKRAPSLLIRSLWSPDFDHRDVPAIRERRRRVRRCHRHGRSSRRNPSRGALHPEGIGERIGLAHDGLARWRDHRA